MGNAEAIKVYMACNADRPSIFRHQLTVLQANEEALAAILGCESAEELDEIAADMQKSVDDQYAEIMNLQLDPESAETVGMRLTRQGGYAYNDFNNQPY